MHDNADQLEGFAALVRLRARVMHLTIPEAAGSRFKEQFSMCLVVNLCLKMY